MLSSIMTGRQAEIDWLYRGAARFFPEEWERFRRGAERAGLGDDVVAGYARLLEDPDPQVRNRASTCWLRWEDAVLSLESAIPPPTDMVPPDPDVLAFTRLCAHYFSRGAFIADGAVIRDAGRLAAIPGVLIHGRQDMSCPVQSAWELARAWPGCELRIDDHSGHLGSDTKRAWMLETLATFAGR
jgi:proline iminopeptidase